MTIIQTLLLGFFGFLITKANLFFGNIGTFAMTKPLVGAFVCGII